MSRVAVAMRRAGLASAMPERIREDDHPWAESFAEPPRLRAQTARPHDILHRPAKSPVVHADDEPAIAVRLESALARFTPDGRQQIATLIDTLFSTVARQPVRSVGFAAVGAEMTSGGLTAAAAELLAQCTSASVCVIDAHVATPTVHQHFGVTNAVGPGPAGGSDLTPSDLARRLQQNLWIVSAGVESDAGRANPESMRAFLMKYVAQFDHVLVHIQLTPHGEGEGLAALLDGVILVLDAESTRREAARRAAAALRASGAAVLGAVMTNRRFPIPEPIYRRL